MARKKKQAESGGSGDWLNTYADMVTLLLTFFILLFSMSTLDSKKFNLLAAAFHNDSNEAKTDVVFITDVNGDIVQQNDRGPSDVITDYDLEDMLLSLLNYIDEMGLTDKVEVAAGENEVLIRFTDDMLFEPNSAQLKADDLALLDFVGDAIRRVQNDASMISVIGYTAAVPEDPDYPVSDRLLSSDRANAVLMYFEDVTGLDGTKLMSTGWGKNKPIAENTTEDGRSKNRRVEILISGENGQSLADQLDNMYDMLVE